VDPRPWLEHLEQAAQDGVDPCAGLAFLAAQELAVDEAELNAARRRAVFVFAAGGDPHRSLDLGSRAVTTLAADLDAPASRAALSLALGSLAAAADGLPAVERALDDLRANEDLAWRWLAVALLAEELAGEEPS
jgi:hypothetical protein